MLAKTRHNSKNKISSTKTSTTVFNTELGSIQCTPQNRMSASAVFQKHKSCFTWYSSETKWMWWKIFLYGWCPYCVLHLPSKNYKCSFKFAKIIVKNLLASFLWTQCICNSVLICWKTWWPEPENWSDHISEPLQNFVKIDEELQM